MFTRRNRNTKILLLSFLSLVILGAYLKHRHGNSRKTNYSVMVWWSPYKNHLDYHRKCGLRECRFTSDHRAKTDNLFMGYLFYGDKFSTADLPPERKSNEYWGLYLDASPKNVPFLLKGLDLFNISATFSRHSSVPLTLQTFTNLEDLIDYKKMYTFGQKTSFHHTFKMAPVFYKQSSCDSLTGRELYISELGKYIPIDSYGECLHNKSLPNGITDNYQNDSEMKDYFSFVAKYKFMIVYQDMTCEDYISENLWIALSFGIIPIYFGAANIKTYLPNQNSAILIEDFTSPAKLAEFLHQVSSNEDTYISFLAHKTTDYYPIANQLLVDRIFKEDMYYFKNRKIRTIAEFECNICTESFRGRKRRTLQKELACELPYFPPGNVTYKALPRVHKYLELSQMEAVETRRLMTCS